MLKKILLFTFILLFMFTLSSCKKVYIHENLPINDVDLSDIELPNDFKFSITWNCYGVSSYDSKTGKLIKRSDADNVKKYTTYVKMSENELKLVFKYLCVDINLFDYDDSFDPFNDPTSENKIWSSPQQTLIISITKNNETKTVSCIDVPLGDEGYNEKANNFLLAHSNVVTLITSFIEWKNIPEYEVYFM